MKKWRYFIALPLFAVGLFAAGPAATDLVLPERLLPQLDVILKNALQQSPRMVNRALDLEIAENNRIEARANLLPTFSASASYLKSDDSNKYTYNTPGNAGNSTVSYVVTKTPYFVTLNQPLFYWGERKNNARMGAIQQLIAQGQYRDGYRALAQEIRASYLRLTVQKLSVKRARFNGEFANRRLKQEEERLVKKVISEAEIFTARLTAEQAQIALERAEFDYANAKASFARLAGLGVMADEAIPDTIPAVTYVAEAFDQLLAGFLAQQDPPSIEAVNFRHQLQIADLIYANQKTRLRPKLSATFGMSQDEQSNFYGQRVRYTLNSLYAGVTVNWAIFDGFASAAATRSALARRRQLENDYRLLTQRLAADAQSQVKLINFSARSMSIYDRFLTSAEGSLKSAQADFRLGLKSDTEVSLAQLYLDDSAINALNTRIDYLLKTGDFLGTVMHDPALANLADQ